jgi:hypothetical protein
MDFIHKSGHLHIHKYILSGHFIVCLHLEVNTRERNVEGNVSQIAFKARGNDPRGRWDTMQFLT